MTNRPTPRRSGLGSGAALVAKPGRMSPRVLRLVPRLVRPVVRLVFRPSLHGTENLPDQGPYLLVANHSAGMGIAEIFSFLALYLERFGESRPLAGFALPIGFRVFPLSIALKGIGAIPATYEAAHETLRKGIPILVFPGGDHETLRPIWQARRVDFGRRTGFIRIAHSAGVPIVPMGIAGSHWTAPILLRSKLLATLLVVPRLSGIKRWGISVLGLAGAIAIAALIPVSLPWTLVLVWIWLGSPLVFLPWVPSTITMRIGAPIPPEKLYPASTAESPETLRAALEIVEASIQDLLRKG